MRLRYTLLVSFFLLPFTLHFLQLTYWKLPGPCNNPLIVPRPVPVNLTSPHPAPLPQGLRV